jgi:ATP-dependent helicase/nuclease subunit B
MQKWNELEKLPAVARIMEGLRNFQEPESNPSLAPELAARLYEKVLRTSVSRLEQFAACPFKFFVHSGLRAEERKMFELDFKEQGNFQHEVLARFHEQLHGEAKQWRDVTPVEARRRVGSIASVLMEQYREGLLQTTDQARFTGQILIESLQDFIETVVGWMRGQYQFEPAQVEMPFGNDEGSPAWEIALGNNHCLAVRGRIDRVDLFRQPGAEEALCVVVDYKSSQKKLEAVLIENGLQLQLLTYLAVLRNWPEPQRLFGVARLIPAGVFYVNLQGKYDSEPNRRAALAGAEEARKLAYQHTGRFDVGALQKLDSRSGVLEGDMFNYRVTQRGQINGNCREPMDQDRFEALLNSVEANLKRMGEKIFSGHVEIDPYRRGAMTACDQCDYRGICRIDPWTHSFRALKSEGRGTG